MLGVHQSGYELSTERSQVEYVLQFELDTGTVEC